MVGHADGSGGSCPPAPTTAHGGGGTGVAIVNDSLRHGDDGDFPLVFYRFIGFSYRFPMFFCGNFPTLHYILLSCLGS